MKKGHSTRASALQITLTLVLLAVSAILFASSFRASPASQPGFYPPLPEPAAPAGVPGITVGLPVTSIPDTTPTTVTVVLPVSTTDINPTTTNGANIVGFQGDFTYDSAVINFATAGTLAPPIQKAGLTGGNWNVTGNVINSGPGTIKIIRISSFSNDFIPLSGSGTLFEIRPFRVGSGGTSTPLNWQPSPDNFYFIDDNLNTLTPVETNGLVTITGTGPSPSPSPSATPTATFTPTATATSTATATATFTPTATATFTPTATATATFTATATATATFTPTATATATATTGASATATFTPTATATFTPTATATSTATATATFTPTATATATSTVPGTPSPTPTSTATSTATATATFTPTATATATFTPTATATATHTPTATATATSTATATATVAASPTATATATATAAASATPTATATATPKPTVTPTPTPAGGCVFSHGYWQNHASAWCMETIQLGCQTYTVSQAIAIMRHNSGHDKTYLLAQELIAAKLNITCSNSDSSCIASAIAAADSFLCDHPIGSGVTGSVWNQIKAVHAQLEKYNTGRLCAPSCESNL